MISHSPYRRRAIRCAGILAPVLLLSACAVGPDFVAPNAPEDSSYLPHDEQKGSHRPLRFDSARELPPQWWESFKSPALDELVDTGLEHSPNVQQAREVLTASQENLAAGQGVFYPALNGGLSGTREVLPPSERNNAGASGSVFNLYTLSAEVSYTFDFFGLERREVEALRANVEQQRALLGATYLSLTSNISNAAIASAAYAQEVEDTQRLAGMEREQLVLIKAQVDAGTTAESVLDTATQALAATEAALPGVRQHQAASQHLLAMLTGYTPAEAPAKELRFEQLTLPENLPSVLPSELVHKRPDIVAAEASLHAASATVGVATAAIYPSVSLDGSYGFSSTQFSKLGEANSRFWSVGPSITIPEIQGAAPWHRKKAAEAEYRQALASYRQTVLVAFQQVADVLTALKNDKDAVAALERAYNASRSLRDIASANEQGGLIDHNTFLAADIQLLNAKINLTQARAQQYQDTVALYAALGGGWDPQQDIANTVTKGCPL